MMKIKELTKLPQEFVEPILPCFRLLKFCNILFFDDRAVFWTVLPYFYVLPCVVVFHLTLTIYFIKGFQMGIDLDELTYIVPVFVFSIQSILKGLIVFFNKKNIRSIILRLGNLWRTQELSVVQISKKNVLLKRLKFCFAVFYWMNMIGSAQYITASLLETFVRKIILNQDFEFLFPFGCYFPYDSESGWGVYLATYLFESYSICNFVFCYLGAEMLMIVLCSHLATEFTLLQEDILHIKPANRNVCHFNELGGCASDLELYFNQKMELKALIRRHQILIGVTQDFDDVFNKMIFVNLSSATISICFFGFSAKVSRDPILLINNFVGFVASIIPIFNLCYYAELLKEASEGIACAAYDSLWYLGDNSYGKMIWFLMKRPQKPCCLTSLKYNPISLNTFTTVMSTTWSYFSLASTFYDENVENLS